MPPKVAQTANCLYGIKLPYTASTRRWSIFDLSVLEDRPGFMLLRVTGPKAYQKFSRESGGHRWQRIPPTEKRGRTHTSTITVAVMHEPTAVDVQIKDSEIEVQTMRGSGAGGQHRNKTDTCVRITHIPTGISVRHDGGRSQAHNRQEAMRILRVRLVTMRQDINATNRENDRRQQVGTGMRGDKVRTVQTQNDRVTNHANGKQVRYKDYARGKLSGLF